MTQSWARRPAAVLLALGALAPSVLPAAAEVRFGPGVRIGGHDFSNRRGDGTVVRGPMEECNLIARPR